MFKKLTVAALPLFLAPAIQSTYIYGAVSETTAPCSRAPFQSEQEKILPDSRIRRWIGRGVDMDGKEIFKKVKNTYYNNYGEIIKERIIEIDRLAPGICSRDTKNYYAREFPVYSDKVYENGLLRSYVETLVNPLTNKVLQITRYSFDYDANGNFRGCEKRVMRPLLSEKENTAYLSTEDISAYIATGQDKTIEFSWPFFGRERIEEGFSASQASLLLITNSENKKLADRLIKEMFAAIETARDAKLTLKHMHILTKLALTDAAGISRYDAYFQEFLETVCVSRINERDASADGGLFAFMAASIIESLNLPAAAAEKVIDSIAAFAKSLDKAQWGCYKRALSALAVITKKHPQFKERIIRDFNLAGARARMYRDFGVILLEGRGRFSDEELWSMRNIFAHCGSKLLSRVGVIEYGRLLSPRSPAIGGEGKKSAAKARLLENAVLVFYHSAKVSPEPEQENAPFRVSYDPAHPGIAANFYAGTLFHEASHLMDTVMDIYTGTDTPLYRLNQQSHKDAACYVMDYGMRDIQEDFATVIEGWSADSAFGLNDAIARAREGKPVLLQKLLVAADAFSFRKPDGREYTRLFKTDREGSISHKDVLIRRDRNNVITKIGDTEIASDWVMKDVWRNNEPGMP